MKSFFFGTVFVCLVILAMLVQLSAGIRPGGIGQGKRDIADRNKLSFSKYLKLQDLTDTDIHKGSENYPFGNRPKEDVTSQGDGIDDDNTEELTPPRTERENILSEERVHLNPQETVAQVYKKKRLPEKFPLKKEQERNLKNKTKRVVDDRNGGRPPLAMSSAGASIWKRTSYKEGMDLNPMTKGPVYKKEQIPEKFPLEKEVKRNKEQKRNLENKDKRPVVGDRNGGRLSYQWIMHY